jgi:hypothetical protein
MMYSITPTGSRVRSFEPTPAPPGYRESTFGFGNCHGLSQKVVHLDDLDPAVAQLLHKVEMVAPGDVDPDHVVVQQFVAIARRQALVGPPRRAKTCFPGRR